MTMDSNAVIKAIFSAICLVASVLCIYWSATNLLYSTVVIFGLGDVAGVSSQNVISMAALAITVMLVALVVLCFALCGLTRSFKAR